MLFYSLMLLIGIGIYKNEKANFSLPTSKSYNEFTEDGVHPSFTTNK